MPDVSFVVTRDGQVRDVKVLWARDRFAEDNARRRASQMRFLPGLAAGRPVDVPLRMRVSGR